eukprot:scaffold482_cov266-Amphora_coffeaeformis.AAC.7
MAPRPEQQSPRPNKRHRHPAPDEDECNDDEQLVVDEKSPLLVVYCNHYDHEDNNDDKYWADDEDEEDVEVPRLCASTRNITLTILLVVTWLIGANAMATRASHHEVDNHSHTWTTLPTEPTPGPTISIIPTTPVPSVSPSSAPTAFTSSCPRDFRNQVGTHAMMLGDASRSDLGARRDENLVLCESFDHHPHNAEHAIWRADKTLFGEGNGGFAYYTPENVVVDNGALYIRPDLFANLGPLQTYGNHTYDAVDVMLGNCTPFPECATLDLRDQNCTIDDFSGCQRIGTPLVALNPVTSGRITTKDRFSMQYGRLEARIRLPQGDWLWPALWMMPVNQSKYGGGWPDSGEFDILESKGNDPVVFGRSGGGRNMFSSCLHYNGNSWWKTRNSLSASDILPVCRDGRVPMEACDWSTDFFILGLYWSPSEMYVYVLREDNIAGNVVQEEVKLWHVDATRGFGPNDYPMGMHYPPFSNEENTPNKNPRGPYADASPNKNAPFDQPFYLILNLNVGGEINGCPNPGYWGPDAVWCTQRDPEKPDLAARTVFWESRDQWYPSWELAKERDRDAFVVDWIKVWQ